MLWYGIGILYDRYGSFDYAEEAFSQVMQIQPEFEKANEIYFRLGIIYKQQAKFTQSLEVCGSTKTNRLGHLALTIVCSASNISLPHHLRLCRRTTFGSKLDMFMNSRKT